MVKQNRTAVIKTSATVRNISVNSLGKLCLDKRPHKKPVCSARQQPINIYTAGDPKDTDTKIFTPNTYLGLYFPMELE